MSYDKTRYNNNTTNKPKSTKCFACQHGNGHICKRL